MNWTISVVILPMLVVCLDFVGFWICVTTCDASRFLGLSFWIWECRSPWFLSLLWQCASNRALQYEISRAWFQTRRMRSQEEKRKVQSNLSLRLFANPLPMTDVFYTYLDNRNLTRWQPRCRVRSRSNSFDQWNCSIFIHRDSVRSLWNHLSRRQIVWNCVPAGQQTKTVGSLNPRSPNENPNLFRGWLIPKSTFEIIDSIDSLDASCDHHPSSWCSICLVDFVWKQLQVEYFTFTSAINNHSTIERK